MKDDELEVWRRQWQAQPAIPIDLIRRVERQTVYLRITRIAQIAPGLVGVGLIIAAIVMQGLIWTLLAVGTWLFILIGWWFIYQNEKGIWAPAAETNAAYLDLSIERCRRKLKDIRFGSVMSVLLTAFVIIADYQILVSRGRTFDSWELIPSAAFTVLVVLLVLAAQAKKRQKTEAELEYLLRVREQLKDQPQ